MRMWGTRQTPQATSESTPTGYRSDGTQVAQMQRPCRVRWHDDCLSEPGTRDATCKDCAKIKRELYGNNSRCDLGRHFGARNRFRAPQAVGRALRGMLRGCNTFRSRDGHSTCRVIFSITALDRYGAHTHCIHTGRLRSGRGECPGVGKPKNDPAPLSGRASSQPINREVQHHDQTRHQTRTCCCASPRNRHASRHCRRKDVRLRCVP